MQLAIKACCAGGVARLAWASKAVDVLHRSVPLQSASGPCALSPGAAPNTLVDASNMSVANCRKALENQVVCLSPQTMQGAF